MTAGWSHDDLIGWSEGQPAASSVPLKIFEETWEAVMGRHYDENKDGFADHAPVTESATEDEAQDAFRATGYQFTDPVADENFPRITAADHTDLPDTFPEDWSSEPTERDQAAIDAGNW